VPLPTSRVYAKGGKQCGVCLGSSMDTGMFYAQLETRLGVFGPTAAAGVGPGGSGRELGSCLLGYTGLKGSPVTRGPSRDALQQPGIHGANPSRCVNSGNGTAEQRHSPGPISNVEIWAWI